MVVVVVVEEEEEVDEEGLATLARVRVATSTSSFCCAFSRVPKQGDKIRSGSLTPAFSGARKWAEMLHKPCIFGGPQQGGQNQKWLPQPCLLRGWEVGGNAT